MHSPIGWVVTLSLMVGITLFGSYEKEQLINNKNKVKKNIREQKKKKTLTMKLLPLDNYSWQIIDKNKIFVVNACFSSKVYTLKRGFLS